MGLADPEVVNLSLLHPSEGCFVEVKGTLTTDIRRADLTIPAPRVLLSEDELRAAVRATGLTVVPAPWARTSTASACARSWTSSTAGSRSSA
jgi:hypothetical protein